MGKVLSMAATVLLWILCGCTPNHSGSDFNGTYHLKTVEELDRLLERSKEEPDNPAILTSIWTYYTQTGQLEELKRHALPVYEAAESSGNDIVRAYSGSYLAQTYLNTDRYDSMKYYLAQVESIVRRHDIRFLTAMNSNTSAIYAIKVDVDFVEALRHFNIALDMAQQTGNHTSEGIVLCNIAYTYLKRYDITGLQYARSAYDLGKEREDRYLLGYGTILMAKLLLLDEEYDSALEYAAELLELSELPGHERHRLVAFLLHGDIYARKRQPRRAEEYYDKALEELGDTGGTSLIETSLSYGNFLLTQERFGEAEGIFSSGLTASDNTRNMENRHELLLGLWKSYEGLDDETRAQEFYRKYRDHSDSVFTVQNERAFNTQMLHYERLDHQQQIQDKEAGLIKATRHNHIYAFALAFVAIILGSTYLLYRRKNRMYRQLVEQHQEYLRREKHIKQIGGIGESNRGDEEADKGEALLYRQLEELMDREHTYRRKDVSLDYLAERLDTNRVYVSRAINQYSGMSFYDYIHSRRIAEAVAALSEEENDLPLKVLSDRLGYNSISAFYRYFQKETGVPPSKYREEARRLHKR